MIVQKRSFDIPKLQLECGEVLENARIGYETCGELNADGTNAILVAHYFSGSSHCAGRFHQTDQTAGYWDSIIGEKKAIDTSKYFVLSCDSLCNLFPSDSNIITTGPATLNPSTGRPFGSRFPVVSIGDFVASQRLVAEHLGIKRFHAVTGPSMGAMQAMEWAVQFPNDVERVIAVISPGLSAEAYLIARLNSWCCPIYLDPDFQGGNYTDGVKPLAGVRQSFKLVNLDSVHIGWAKREFGRAWAKPTLDPATSLKNDFAIERFLDEIGALRADLVDANSILRLVRALQNFSIEDRIDRLRARFLFIPAKSDLLMFPQYSLEAAEKLRSIGVAADVHILEGDGGHLDGLTAIARAGNTIANFLDSNV